MIRLITFATDNFTISAEKLEKSALNNGADKVDIYTPYDFDQTFERIITPLIEESRGHGWWQWKPWMMLNAITEMKDNGYLIYSDAGQEIIAPLQSIIDAMDKDIILFTNGFQHSHWCKREVALAINQYYWPPMGVPVPENKQVQASFIIFKVNDNTRKFIQEWYAWSIMPGMIDNVPRGTQFPEFQEHRHDQAILTCLQIKYGYKLHWFPSTTNLHRSPPELGYYSERYPVTIEHHRRRNEDW